MADEAPAVEVTVEEATETPTVEVEVEVESETPTHDVEFAERLTRLEMRSDSYVTRDELNNVYSRIDAVEQLAVTNAAVTEAVVETVEEVVTEAATEPEPQTETTPEPEEAPNSKRHKWWGNK